MTRDHFDYDAEPLSDAESERLLALATALRRHGEELLALGAALSERWIESATARPAQLTTAYAAVQALGLALAAFDGHEPRPDYTVDSISALGRVPRPLTAGEIRHDHYGFYYLTRAEASFEDEGHPSVGSDLRPHFSSRTEAAAHGAAVERGSESNH